MRTITEVVIHHSVSQQYQTLEKSIKSFDNTHQLLHPLPNRLGYHIAYHYVIAGNWQWAKTRWLDEIGFHASNWEANKRSVWICMTWNFDEGKPSEWQLASVNYLLSELYKKFGDLKVTFHNEYARKSCPWLNVTKDMFIAPYQYSEEELKNFAEARKSLWLVYDSVPEMRDTINEFINKSRILWITD